MPAWLPELGYGFLQVARDWTSDPKEGRMMPEFEVQDQNFELHIRTSFGKQRFMSAIGADLSLVSPGKVEIVLPFREDLLQQHGFLHGAVIAGVVDSACGYAARSLMPRETTVMTVEYKINFLAPAAGDEIVARGRVLRSGRKLSVCYGEAAARVEGKEKLVAALMATMIPIRDRPLSK